MKLLTKEVKIRLAKVGWRGTEGKPHDEVKVLVKFFHPVGRFTLYVTEFDGSDTFYGYVRSPLGPDCDEWGYSSLSELQSIRVMGLGIERDIHWNPETTVAEVLAGVKA